MRKIDASIVSAIRNRRDFTSPPYEVRMTLSPREGFELYYHSSRIVWTEQWNVYASLCGYDTPATRGKINLICAAFGLGSGLYRHNGVTYLREDNDRRPISTTSIFTIFRIGVMA